MLSNPMLITILCVAVAVGLFGVIGFTRRFGLKALRRLPFVPPPSAPLYFVRWLTAEQSDALRAAGVDCTRHIPSACPQASGRAPLSRTHGGSRGRRKVPHLCLVCSRRFLAPEAPGAAVRRSRRRA